MECDPESLSAAKCAVGLPLVAVDAGGATVRYDLDTREDVMEIHEPGLPNVMESEEALERKLLTKERARTLAIP